MSQRTTVSGPPAGLSPAIGSVRRIAIAGLLGAGALLGPRGVHAAEPGPDATFVILARDPQASAVVVTWVLTEDGNDTVTRGELEVATGELTDAADLLKAAFFKDR